MAGQKLTRTIGKRLTAYGEDEIFALYLQHGGVRPLLKNMPEKVGPMSTGVFYSWLKETPERISKWQMVQEIQGSNWAEQALEIVDGADPENVQVARLQADTRRWLAERFNRKQFGKPEVAATVGITIGDEFLESLKKVEEWAKAKRIAAKSEEVLEADYEVVDEDGDPYSRDGIDE
jgi:hypothetical protein|tara:strand:- start:703 stop:1233 length:531 start_codon:yes stop_codon:yes gene_type:complete